MSIRKKLMKCLSNQDEEMLWIDLLLYGNGYVVINEDLTCNRIDVTKLVVIGD